MAPFYLPKMLLVLYPSSPTLPSCLTFASPPLTGLAGKFTYSKNFGTRTKLDGSTVPLEQSDIVFLASSSKLFTTLTCLQCVERGLISLDEDVGRVIPHLGSIGVLTGFDEVRYGQPHIEAKKGPITLR